MTPKELAHEFFLGIRTAMTCPDVSVAEYEGVIAYKIEKLLVEEREAIAKHIEEQNRMLNELCGGHRHDAFVRDITKGIRARIQP